MKRRKFLAGLGLSAPALLVGRQRAVSEQSKLVPYPYPEFQKLEDATDELGRLAIFLQYNAPIAQAKQLRAGTQVQKGRENSRKHYYFASGETLIDQPSTDPALPVEIVTVIWLNEFSPETEITVGDDAFTLGTLLSQPEWHPTEDPDRITAFLLGHHEIGEIDPTSFLGELPQGTDRYSFAIMADPQGGDPSHDRYAGSSARMHIHNAFIAETIERINELENRPLFTLVLGDYTDHQGEMRHFEAMNRLFSKLSTPVLLEIGNHETRYAAEFRPGYRMDAFDNYFGAQQRINGLEKLLYSFNLGAYHYIVWPDPLRKGFWETHPHYFDWLERDLEKYKDAPTLFFQHVPVHPIGIDPLVHYAEKPYIKKLLLDLLTRHGNVKYVFSGHVHIPLKSSVKTAVTYRGINFINLPAAGYRPRAFGEEDYFGGPAQGAAIVAVDGEDIQVDYVDVTRNVFTYPGQFPHATLQEASPLILNKWELAKGTQLQNGNLASQEHWHSNYIYQEDHQPTYLRRICEKDSLQSIYLRANKRRYDKPGQDRLPQTLNQLTQVVFAPDGRFSEIELRMLVECEHFYERALVGAFVWIEGYWGHHKQYSLIYSAGKIPASLSNRFNRSPQTVIVHRHLPAKTGAWSTVILNPEQDLAGTEQQPIDRWAINLGVWNINDGNNEGIGAYFASIEQRPPGEQSSRLDGQPLGEKHAEMIYTLRVDHTAGEHVIASQDELYFYDV
jgi:3',5'-cyclic AMP phosphodiesterase CpdA